MRNQERSKPSARQGNRLQRLALNAGAFLGSLCLLMTLAALLFGLKPLVFVSGSMGPGIPAGSLGLAVPTPVEDVAVGDVVSVVTSDDVRVTHRVAAKTEAGLILKGDANPVADLHPYAVDSADKLLVSFPGVGYLVSWLSQPWAYFLGGLLCAYLLYVAFFKRDGAGKRLKDPAGGTTDEQLPKKSISKMFLGLSVLSTILSAGLISGLVMHPVSILTTQAAFTGSAKATTGALTARSMPTVPGTLKCTTTGGILGAATSAEVVWSPATTLPPGAKYAVRVQSVAGDIRYLSANAGTEKISFNGGLSLLGLLFGKAQTFEARILTATTTDGAAVNEQGTNIGWSSPVSSAPKISIDYKPGVLILDSYSCPKA
ncbi:signal peptidase [Arthrobacter sp. AG1021]|nr:signal peptidase [Arthrobacter sp. AG1021]